MPDNNENFEYSMKDNLSNAWKANPAFRIVTIVVVLILILAISVAVANVRRVKQESLSKVKVAVENLQDSPFAEKSDAYREALNKDEDKRLEAAVEKGQSVLPYTGTFETKNIDKFSQEEGTSSFLSLDDLEKLGFGKKKVKVAKKIRMPEKNPCGRTKTKQDTGPGGYNRHGINGKGYDKDGYLRDCLTEADFDADGYAADGYDKFGYDRNGLDKDGYDKFGYNKSGYDKDGYDKFGYNKDGFNSEGYDKDGYNERGFNKEGLNRKGTYRDGLTDADFGADGYAADGYDRQGYDRNGYDRDGYDRDGYNKDGYDKDGYNRNGINRQGLNKDGQYRDGLTEADFGPDGYAADGYDKFGYDRNGLDKNGFDKNGFDKNGYDKDGYNKAGYNRNGINRQGLNKDGKYRDGLTEADFGPDGYAADGFDKWGYDRDGYDKNGYDRWGNKRPESEEDIGIIYTPEQQQKILENKINLIGSQMGALVNVAAPVYTEVTITDLEELAEMGMLGGTYTSGSSYPYAVSNEDLLDQDALLEDLEEEELIVPAGHISYAVTLTESNSRVPGPVLVKILSGPLKGFRALGGFTVADDYLVIKFHKAILGYEEYDINAYALDPTTTLPGMASEIDRHYFRRFVLPIAASFIEGLGAAVSESSTEVNVSDGVVTETEEPSKTSEEVWAAVEAAGKTTGEILEEFKRDGPTIKVLAGSEMGILFVVSVYGGDNVNK